MQPISYSEYLIDLGFLGLDINEYSFFIAILWCNVFVILTSIIRRSNKAILKVGVSTLITGFIFALLRILCSIEILGFTKVISTNFFVTDSISWTFRTKIDIFGLDIYLIYIIVAACLFISFCIISYLIISQIRGIKYYKKGFIYGDRQRIAMKTAHVLLDEMGIKRHTEVFVTKNASSPLMFGLFKLSIFLPDVDYSDYELRNVLLHEITHFKNHDSWYKLVAKIACALLWWNPPIWLLFFEMDKSLELKCDYAIVKDMTKDEEISYLESIYKACEKKKLLLGSNGNLKSPGLSLGMINRDGSKEIKQRMKIITQYKNGNQLSRKAMASIWIFIFATFCLSFAFVIQPVGGHPIYEERLDVLPDDAYAVLKDDGNVLIYIGLDYYGDEEILWMPYEYYERYYNYVPFKFKDER